jgi:hypothetical protein
MGASHKGTTLLLNLDLLLKKNAESRGGPARFLLTTGAYAGGSEEGAENEGARVLESSGRRKKRGGKRGLASRSLCMILVSYHKSMGGLDQLVCTLLNMNLGILIRKYEEFSFEICNKHDSKSKQNGSLMIYKIYLKSVMIFNDN